MITIQRQQSSALDSHIEFRANARFRVEQASGLQRRLSSRRVFVSDDSQLTENDVPGTIRKLANDQEDPNAQEQ